MAGVRSVQEHREWGTRQLPLRRDVNQRQGLRMLQRGQLQPRFQSRDCIGGRHLGRRAGRSGDEDGDDELEESLHDYQQQQQQQHQATIQGGWRGLCIKLIATMNLDVGGDSFTDNPYFEANLQNKIDVELESTTKIV